MLRYLSAVVAREAHRPGVVPPVPNGPERVRDITLSPAANSRCMTWSCRSRGNTVAVLQQHHALLVRACERNRSVVDECGGHGQVGLLEPMPTTHSADHEGASDALGCEQQQWGLVPLVPRWSRSARLISSDRRIGRKGATPQSVRKSTAFSAPVSADWATTSYASSISSMPNRCVTKSVVVICCAASMASNIGVE
jgi:hypothetical protein